MTYLLIIKKERRAKCCKASKRQTRSDQRLQEIFISRKENTSRMLLETEKPN